MKTTVLKEALAGLLKVAYEQSFSEEQYSKIKAVKGKRDKDDGSNPFEKRKGKRNRRDDRQMVDMKGQTRLFVAKGRIDGMNPKN